jgi:hypothetical protein
MIRFRSFLVQLQLDCVSNTPVVATEQGGKKDDVEPEHRHDVAKTEEATHGPKRGTRARRPNMRVQGPEWV